MNKTEEYFEVSMKNNMFIGVNFGELNHNVVLIKIINSLVVKLI